jgi:septum formation protein
VPAAEPPSPATAKPPAKRALYLASGSRSRIAILKNAGLAFVAHAPGIDEAEVKAAMKADGADAAAAALAGLKAQKVSLEHPEGLVIGSDQILECGGVWFDKPADIAGARAMLQTLRGRTHRLVGETQVFLNGARIWSHADVAELTMRNFSDHFLDYYLMAVGSRVLEVVGGYEVEGVGAQLFAKITGDHFAILGLPLLPLLELLREHGVVPQ